jgi:hypothetical protein
MLIFILGEFLDVLLYIKNLEFEDKPNYEYIRGQFKHCYNKQPFAKEESITDWQLLRKQKRDQRRKIREEIKKVVSKAINHVEFSNLLTE